MNAHKILAVSVVALLAAPGVAHAGDYLRGTDTARAMYEHCDSDLSPRCADLAAATMCNFNALMARSERTDRMPLGYQTRALAQMAQAMADHVTLMERMVENGSLRNITRMSSRAEKERYCRSVGGLY